MILLHLGHMKLHLKHTSTIVCQIEQLFFKAWQYISKNINKIYNNLIHTLY